MPIATAPASAKIPPSPDAPIETLGVAAGAPVIFTTRLLVAAVERPNPAEDDPSIKLREIEPISPMPSVEPPIPTPRAMMSECSIAWIDIDPAVIVGVLPLPEPPIMLAVRSLSIVFQAKPRPSALPRDAEIGTAIDRIWVPPLRSLARSGSSPEKSFAPRSKLPSMPPPAVPPVLPDDAIASVWPCIMSPAKTLTAPVTPIVPVPVAPVSISAVESMSIMLIDRPTVSAVLVESPLVLTAPAAATPAMRAAVRARTLRSAKSATGVPTRRALAAPPLGDWTSMTVAAPPAALLLLHDRPPAPAPIVSPLYARIDSDPALPPVMLPPVTIAEAPSRATRCETDAANVVPFAVLVVSADSASPAAIRLPFAAASTATLPKPVIVVPVSAVAVSLVE